MSTDSSHCRIQLNAIDVLNQAHCKIRDRQRVEQIINEIYQGGPNELQVVTDFDFTLTKQISANGKPTLSSFGMFNRCKSVPTSFRDESKKLHDKYRPIEIDPNLSQTEKKAKIIDWWIESGEIIKGFPFEQKDFEDIAKEYGKSLRDGTHDFLELTNKTNVPVLVFSAGLGDSIVAVMQHEKVLFPNVKVVSNFLKYENGLVNGFTSEYPIIHTFNKNETVLQGTEYYEMVHNRKHVILMGDSLADADMAKGVPKTSSVLKIGFLYDHPETNLPHYLDCFDIVLIDDQTMNIPNKILSLIVNQNQNQNHEKI